MTRNKSMPGRGRPRPYRGRPPSRPWHPNAAARAVRAYYEAETDEIDAKFAKDVAFIAMCKSGMLAGQIAKATGLSVPGVYHIAGELRQKVRNTRTETPTDSPRAIERRTNKPGGSVLFD